jgi:hypothetical protein
MGTSRRDSASATSSASLDSAAVSEVEQRIDCSQDDTISRGTSVTEESQEQPASESLNATTRNPLKQEPGERLVE